MARGPARTAPVRAWQRMLSGRRLDLLDPSPLDVEIEDIAHGLSRVARWNGQTSGDHIYSVAQHSLLVEAIAGRLWPELSAGQRLAILLHDAAEYVVGDLISPFKAVLGGDYKAVENRILGAVMLRFSLPPLTGPLARRCKDADRIAAYQEAVTLAGFSAEEARKYFGEAPEWPLATFGPLLVPLSANLVKVQFLQRFVAISQTT